MFQDTVVLAVLGWLSMHKERPLRQHNNRQNNKKKKHKVKVWCNGYPSPVTQRNTVTTKPLAKISTHEVLV